MRTLFAPATISLLLLAIAGFAPNGAEAGPVTGWAQQSPSLVTNAAMYRRHYRGAAPLAAEPYDGAVMSEAVPAPLVVVRPSSCGQYKYWNGMGCVDARYTNPHLGLKG